jgi:ketosteroid isomerase-like protein
MQRLVALRGHLTINPRTFVRSDDLVLVLGTFTLSGRREDGTAFERTSRFADVLRRQPDGRWLLAVDNPVAMIEFEVCRVDAGVRDILIA